MAGCDRGDDPAGNISGKVQRTDRHRAPLPVGTKLARIAVFCGQADGQPSTVVEESEPISGQDSTADQVGSTVFLMRLKPPPSPVCRTSWCLDHPFAVHGLVANLWRPAPLAGCDSQDHSEACGGFAPGLCQIQGVVEARGGQCVEETCLVRWRLGRSGRVGDCA